MRAQIVQWQTVPAEGGVVVRSCARSVVVLIAAVSAAACTVGPQPRWAETGGTLNNWQVILDKDPIFGNSKIATLTLNYNVNLATGDIRSGHLDLLCHKSKPLVRLRFNYKVGSNQSASLAYRFDDNPGVEAKARFLRDFSTIVVEDPSEVRRFLAELTTASKLLMRVDSLIVGRTNIELNVQGAATAMDAALSACPLPPMTADKGA